TPIGGTVPYDVFVARTDPTVVRLQLDVGNMVIGGGDPFAYLQRYRDRYWSFHLKDVVADRSHDTELGTGTLDFRRLLAAVRDLEPYALGPDGVGAVDQTPRQVGGRVVEQMQGVARLRLPRERLQQSFTFDRHGLRPVAAQPADRVLEQSTQVRIPGAPERTVHVAGEIRHPRVAVLPEHGGRLVGARRARVDHLGREGRIRRDHGQSRPTGCAEAHGETALGPGQEGRAFEARQHRMAPLDPHVAVRGGAYDLARRA